MDLKKVLSHIEETLPSTLHLPVSSKDTATITLICLGETTQFIAVKRPLHILCLPTACSATSTNFYLPPCYEGPPLEVNISLDMENLNMINISSVSFHIWQHLQKHQNENQLLHWPVYLQFQSDNSTITWPKDLNI